MTTDPTKAMLDKIMDLSSQRQRVLMHNLANVNTPGYQRKDMAFQEELAKAIDQGPQAITALQPQAATDESAPSRLDGNSVQLELELSELQKNAMWFEMAMTVKGMRTSLQKMAVTGRT
jgi:flagellar basal-body rod protein FlgB